ncbi:EAL domain-containing protein [Pseudomonas sp. TKO26]|uniref:EAL domain, c-di-GMP-specific phosphodiesterase class I (Or its enzymatically inactive variant) n=1 Tax=Pseudomonas saponiphila TaxID=556534 RepID=A0A1H4L8K9_9PSED|nr:MULTISPECIES: EAL domain-containing protein [Pseudomonas]PYY81637.1 EAL domain-containing protein [Pseudomonas sp. TKO30]PYY82928.1 EAL domain-containing protein [Pseudomonas sp. TKO29]PYY84738.1 EAL domain-containing protein [Pseudomonas sp. TKO26]PYY97742.1 EAL domain-containing protein [Pseudomonas sp. TKO14]SEB67089.1 EAL domain, c-di-GMP-specific phosphodiesterase class I (or its enzymatically inactive variant) [Pseudomonas saponiphila]
MIDGQPLACFQPFIDTATGRIAGVEALGRLRQGNGQLTSVGPLFADPRTPSSALRRLDRLIRDDALRRLREAPADWFLSLNISPRWISRLRPGQALPSLRQIQHHAVDPRRIVFEITELGGNSQRLSEVVARYRQAGARIAIDDFGAGYSQLDRVLALQPDILKLDMRLFQAAARGGPSSDVVKALAQMAEKTGCWIIAEGVETEAELDFALECGSRYVQGFLFAGAQEQLFASDAFVQPFARLRERYVRHKLAERKRLMHMRLQLAELMHLLQAWAQAQAPISQLPEVKAFPWLLRFYQCDRHGTQLTPNLEWRHNHWQADSSYVGHNWSWRPYFYHLLAEGWEERRLTLSSTYRDATSNQYCLTAGQFFDNGQRLLLIDIDAAGL